MTKLPIYFSDIFSVSENDLAKYGALDISLVSDLPLFIDPFLLFNSEKVEYQTLHKHMIQYILFLKDKALKDGISKGLLKTWYKFPEEKRNWLGFTKDGNGGRGLGIKFANSLYDGFRGVFSNFGDEEILESAHLEKFGLMGEGVGKDNISDFTTNLIKNYLLEYTERFALKYISEKYIDSFIVDRAIFNYTTETWQSKTFQLPVFGGDFVILTPVDILRQGDVWISRRDLHSKFFNIVSMVENDALRSSLNNYLNKMIIADKAEERQKQKTRAINYLLNEYPDLLDIYIKLKEDSGEEASAESSEAVGYIRSILIQNVRDIVSGVIHNEDYRNSLGNSLEEAKKRVIILKKFIEDQDGWKFFYDKKRPIKNEGHLQLMYRLTWHGSYIDINREVNNGRGPVDYVASFGSFDKTLIEFKLASNTSLKKNLQNQVEAYKTASETKNSIKVIMFFDDKEQEKVLRILEELELSTSPEIYLIDASPKQSASKIS